VAEHRVSMLSASLRRFEDPARSADPQIRQLVAQLATLDPAPPPRAHFRAELREQLVAVAPRLVAEGQTITAPPPTERPAGAAHAAPRHQSKVGALFGRRGRISIARPLGVLTAVIALFAVLLGGAVWVSKKSLPGDALYSLKRANEDVQLSFATGDKAKGREYLSFARTRAEEVAALLKRSSSSASGAGPAAAGGISAHTAHLIQTTLNAADSDLRNGSQLLSGQAARNGTTSSLSIITSWAPGQLTRLQKIADRLGTTGPLHDRAAASSQLTSEAYARAKELKAVVDCDCLTESGTDELGPLPCTDCASPRNPGGPNGTSGGATPSAPSNGAPPTASVPGTGSTDAPPSGSASTPGGSATPPSTDATTPGVPPVTIELPTLPILPSNPAASDDTSTDQTCTLDLLGICVHL
jgi:hypothetical protein